MFSRLSAAFAAVCLLSAPAFAQGGAKPTDAQIAHIAYTADLIDITAAKQAISKSTNKAVQAFARRVSGFFVRHPVSGWWVPRTEPEAVPLIGAPGTGVDADDTDVTTDRMSEEELLKGLEGLTPPESQPEPDAGDEEE